MPNYRQAAIDAANRYGINPGIFTNQIAAESGFNPNAVSPAGAQGIAQIVPKWHPSAPKMNDPIGQLDYAARHMSNLVGQYGNYKDALSVYNSGRPWAEGQGIGETNNYVHKILGGNVNTSAGRHDSFSGPTLNIDDARKTMMRYFFENNQRYLAGQPRKPILNLFRELKQGVTAPTSGRSTPSDIPITRQGSSSGSLGSALDLATQMGLTVREHPDYDKVDPVHVEGSFHYSGRAADITGNPQTLAAFARRVEELLGTSGITELFYDPLNYSIDNGKKGKYTIGGHGNHLHFAI